MKKKFIEILTGLAALALLAACGEKESGKSEASASLDGNWTLSYAGQPEIAARTPSDFKKLRGLKTIPAKVPGTAQLDLQRAGVEPTP